MICPLDLGNTLNNIISYKQLVVNLIVESKFFYIKAFWKYGETFSEQNHRNSLK